MKLKDKQQIIIILVAVLVVAGFLILGYMPLSKKIRKKHELKKQQEMSAQEVAIQETQIPVLQARLSSLSEEVGDFNAKIPYGRDFAPIWQKLTQVMNQHELTDRLVQPGKEIQGETICMVPLNIECSGRLKEIYDFLEDVEGFEREICIEKINIKNDEAMGGNLKLRAFAKIYYRPELVGVNEKL